MLELQTRMTNVRWFIQFANYLPVICLFLDSRIFYLKSVHPDFVGKNYEYAR